MNKPFIAGNWKMFKTVDEAVNLVQGIKAGVGNVSDATVVLCPPYTVLDAVSQQLKGTRIELGAQNMNPNDEGAFTGEISPVMIKEIGCRYVVLGHSERRQIFGETDEFINEKVQVALKYNMLPILCIGETLDQRESGQYFEVVKNQIEKGLSGISKEGISKVVLAYEPVWAIGTGKTATPEQAEQMHSYIRRLLNERCGEEVGKKVNILYGGSVKPDNIASLISKPNVDGALVGGASLKAESFIALVENSVAQYQVEARA